MDRASDEPRTKGATAATTVDPRQIQRALVCILFDPAYEAQVRGDAPMEELSSAERALLRGVDPRALRTDPMRRPRALQAILEEYPLSAALLGVPAVDAFFSSPIFRAAVFNRGSMALAFAEFLGERTRGVGSIEAAIARVRRATARPPAAPPGSVACDPRIAPLITPRGTLTWVQEARERLGPAPLQALAALPRPWRRRPPRGGAEHLLVEAKEDGSIAIGGASEPLVRLLLAADPPRPRASMIDAAIRLGAEADEAAELLDDLKADGLLVTLGEERGS